MEKHKETEGDKTPSKFSQNSQPSIKLPIKLKPFQISESSLSLPKQYNASVRPPRPPESKLIIAAGSNKNSSMRPISPPNFVMEKSEGNMSTSLIPSEKNMKNVMKFVNKGNVSEIWVGPRLLRAKQYIHLNDLKKKNAMKGVDASQSEPTPQTSESDSDTDSSSRKKVRSLRDIYSSGN